MKERESQYPLFCDLPPLSEDELEDARFRGKDLGWSIIAAVYDECVLKGGITYQALGDRIGRSKQQVQKWIDGPQNMTLQSLSLLAEGMDADLKISVDRRPFTQLVNQCHPADEARGNAARDLHFRNLELPNTVMSSKGDLHSYGWEKR